MKVSEFRVKFVEICEWFDGFDRLKIIFKSLKKDYQIILYFKNN